MHFFQKNSIFSATRYSQFFKTQIEKNTEIKWKI